jgi:hypothetical protein
MRKASVRKARHALSFRLRKGDVDELDEMAEWLREKGFEHADREVALETLLREFFRSHTVAAREFRAWFDAREDSAEQ